MEQKLCNTCGIEKSEEEFSFKNKSKNKRTANCKACHKIYHKTWYESNKKDVIKRVGKNNERYSERAKEIVANYLFQHPCIDCGEDDIRVLDFDHLDNKKYNVSVLLGNNGVSEKNLLDEISKCAVRCANCHRKKTSREFGFWKERYYT